MQVNSNSTITFIRAVIIFIVAMLIAACSNHRSVKFEQVYSGMNGPIQMGVQYFSSQTELDNSWITHSLNNAAYQTLLEQVDFSKQVIVAFSAGELKSFSGKIQIIDIYQYTEVSDFPINLRIKIGILKNECEVNVVSLPFVIAIIERPKDFQPVGGYDVATFEDECRKSRDNP